METDSWHSLMVPNGVIDKIDDGEINLSTYLSQVKDNTCKAIDTINYVVIMQGTKRIVKYLYSFIIS